MTEIKVTLRGPMDRGQGRTDSLIAELGELGEVDVVERIEKRWQPTAEEVRAVIITLTTTEILVPVTKAAYRWVRSRFRAPGEPKRIVEIYGPKGEVLAEVEMPESD